VEMGKGVKIRNFGMCCDGVGLWKVLVGGLSRMTKMDGTYLAGLDTVHAWTGPSYLFKMVFCFVDEYTITWSFYIG
jgi:hypothetical protein